MPITFNTILHTADFNLAHVRLLRHKDNRAVKGRTPYELWRYDRQGFDLYQSTQSIKNRNKLTAPYWASFLGTPTGGTLFVGIYRAEYRGVLEQDQPMPHMDGVDKAGSCDVYNLTLEERLSERS